MESTMDSTPVVQAPAVPDSADEARPVRHLIDQTTANLIARVNAVSLTGEELMLSAAEIHKLPIDTCNREARTRCLTEMFNGQRGKASVANLRLESLARLVDAEKIPPCWVQPTMLRYCVFSAAATEPLLFTANNEPFFDAESFVAFLLETEADGNA
jgi:hypothetical protein